MYVCACKYESNWIITYIKNNKFYFGIVEYSSQIDCGFREIAFTRNLKVREKAHAMHVILVIIFNRYNESTFDIIFKKNNRR